MSKKLETDMRISLLGVLASTAKTHMDHDYYKAQWDNIITDNVLATAIENDIAFLKILETYLYGVFYSSVLDGVIYIRSLEKGEQNG